jgi:hypothetical protein
VEIGSKQVLLVEFTRRIEIKRITEKAHKIERVKSTRKSNDVM